MNYDSFFHQATGLSEPFRYQRRLAEEPWPEAVDVPTGLGKTAAVTLAWLYKRANGDPSTPRRLVWCLPMRVLVEQTQRNVEEWLRRLGLGGKPGEAGKISVHVLMGGESTLREAEWVLHPESDAILIGTQDMLLSRALMRGYGMSRYQWPIHFGLLHNDAMWVFDEVQLMGVGLQTSAQLEAFRRKLPMGAGSRSLWISATLNPVWLNTVDFSGFAETLPVLTLTQEEQSVDSVRTRREALKHLSAAKSALTEENAKAGAADYIRALCTEVLVQHEAGTQTIVILNTVDRAQALFTALEKSKSGTALLVHARFRRAERNKINSLLTQAIAPDGIGRIVIATQAIEAGVDITSRTLFTELAPWASIVQRFGRCNRYGECNEAGGANAFWIDVEDVLAHPYEKSDLQSSKRRLQGLESASPARLAATDQAAATVSILRQRDFLGLFNTDPDLSGFDLDIAPYIRDAEDLDVEVFWRVRPDASQSAPRAEEICRASLSQLKRYLEKRKKTGAAWRWDSLEGKWKPFLDRLRPGLVLMLDATLGGYDERTGFLPDQLQHPVFVLADLEFTDKPESFDADRLSNQNKPIELTVHLGHVETEVRQLAASLGLSARDFEAAARAARWHDVGKAHEVFQTTMLSCGPMSDRANSLWAKSPCRGRHERRHFRHELASMLAWIIHHPSDADADLIAYLILAHHGRVRMSLRAMPGERPPQNSNARFARGVWEGDRLPAIALATEQIPETTLRMDLMEVGEGEMGASWTERTQALLDEYGPFRLAWLEALVRIADWRASNKEQKSSPSEFQS